MSPSYENRYIIVSLGVSNRRPRTHLPLKFISWSASRITPSHRWPVRICAEKVLYCAEGGWPLKIGINNEIYWHRTPGDRTDHGMALRRHRGHIPPPKRTLSPASWYGTGWSPQGQNETSAGRRLPLEIKWLRMQGTAGEYFLIGGHYVSEKWKRRRVRFRSGEDFIHSWERMYRCLIPYMVFSYSIMDFGLFSWLYT